MDGRSKTIQQCADLGKILLAAGNPAADEVMLTYNTYCMQQNHSLSTVCPNTTTHTES